MAETMDRGGMVIMSGGGMTGAVTVNILGAMRTMAGIMDRGGMVVMSGRGTMSAVMIIAFGETSVTAIAATTISRRFERISKRFARRETRSGKIGVNCAKTTAS